MLILPMAVHAESLDADSGYTGIPAMIPQPANGSNYYIHLSTKDSDKYGNGAFLPKSIIKIYSSRPPSENPERSTITVNVVGGDEACDGLLFATRQGKPNANNENQVSWGSQSAPKDVPADCAAQTFVLDAGKFTLSNVEGHENLYVSMVEVALANPHSAKDGRTASLRLSTHGGTRIGYAADQKVNLHGANDGTRNTKAYDMVFRPQCNAFDSQGSSITKTISWRDDDYGTYNGGPDVPGAGPEDSNLIVTMGEYPDGWTSSSQVNFYNLSDATNRTHYNFSYSGVDGTGHATLTFKKGYSYALTFNNVDGGNTIQVEYPYDSADFYIGCPDDTPPAVSATVSCSDRLLRGIAYDPSKAGQNLRIDVYNADTNAQIGTTSTTQGLYYAIDMTGVMGTAPNGTFRFKVVASGIDENGSPNGKNGTYTASVTCGNNGGLPYAKGCPSMPQGYQSVNVPDRDNVPASDTDNPPDKVTQDWAGAIVFTRTPTGNGGKWQHRVNDVYDQWGTHDPGYLPNAALDAQLGTGQGGWATEAFAISYVEFMKQYPYDYHNLTISYDTRYLETMYVYNKELPETYCDAGTVQLGNNCATWYQSNDNGSNHCPFGGSWNGSNGEGVGKCYTGTAPAKHYYGANTVSAIKTAPNTYGNTPELSPCYNRTWELDSVQTGNVLLSPTYENPNQVTFNSSISSRYGFVPITDTTNYQPYTPPGGSPVRSPFTASVTWASNYYVKSADGTQTPLYSKPNSAGSDYLPKSYSTGPTNTYSIVDSAGISVPPLRPGDKICQSVEAWDRNGEMKNDGDDPARGNNPITFIVGSGQHIYSSEACSAPIVNQPYTHFLGSDVSAGAGFGDSCPVTSGSINTYTTATGTLPRGSGSQFGAMAQGTIEGMSSATLRDAAPTGSLGLSFANAGANQNGGLPAANLGGNMGLNSGYCVPDYFSKKPAKMTTPDPAASASIGGAGGTQYYKPTGGTLTIGGGSVPVGVKQAIFVEGNVYINGNISFDGAASGWPTLASVPSLYIVVKNGNISIDPSVTQLDGVFVAQPNGNDKGIINTCATASFQFRAYQLFDSCKNQLVVNGAFVANKVFLNRSFGSLRFSTNRESTLYGDIHPCGNPAGGDIPLTGPLVSRDCAAEVFNFSPEFYLAQPAITPSTGPTTGKYDNVTSLSPVL
jgi:hypothetical protein